MHSGYCIDRSVSYALDREQIVMPKTILSASAARRPPALATKLSNDLAFCRRELWMMIIPPTSVVRADEAIE